MNEEKPPPGVIGFWHRIEDAALVLALGAMIILAFIQIVLRNLGDTGLYWADGMLRYLVLWIGLLGAMIATRERNHISVDLLSYALQGRPRSLVKVLTDGFSLAVCTVLTVGSVGFVLNEKAEQLRAFGKIPAWVAELILPVSFLVMSLRFLGHFGQDLRQLVSEPSDPTPNHE